jgi:hypothetical protein
MNRTVRLVSLLRWTAVAMHTAFAVSSYVCIAISIFQSSQWLLGLLLLIDFPVTAVILLPAYALSAFGPSPAIRVVFCTIFIFLGGFQWYLIAGLLARWTCGFQKAIPVASRRFGIAIALRLLFVGGCAIIPWWGQLERVLCPRIKGPYAPPPVAFSGDSKDLPQSVVVPTLDTPMPEHKNVVWCGTLQLAWNRLGKDVLHQPPQVPGPAHQNLDINR